MCLLLALTGLRRDDDDATSTTRTIDSSCRSILQHIDRSDVLRRNTAQRARHAIDKDKRCRIARDGRDTTQTDLCGLTRVTRRASNRETGNFTSDKVTGIVEAAGIEVFRLDTDDSRSDISLLLCTVTNDYNLIERLKILFKRDVTALSVL